MTHTGLRRTRLSWAQVVAAVDGLRRGPWGEGIGVTRRTVFVGGRMVEAGFEVTDGDETWACDSRCEVLDAVRTIVSERWRWRG